MTNESILRQALGEQWHALPNALQAHYTVAKNADVGTLDIDYPGWMQFFLNVLHWMGALLNQRGKGLVTKVEKDMAGDRQYWKRTISLPDGKEMYFTSTWFYAGGNQLIEYVNPVMGLCMAVSVNKGRLYYEGKYYVFNLIGLKIPLPEWLLLGHTTIVETAVDETYFSMDFRLKHPLFGQIYRYAGTFTTSYLDN